MHVYCKISNKTEKCEGTETPLPNLAVQGQLPCSSDLFPSHGADTRTGRGGPSGSGTWEVQGHARLPARGLPVLRPRLPRSLGRALRQRLCRAERPRASAALTPAVSGGQGASLQFQQVSWGGGAGEAPACQQPRGTTRVARKGKGAAS